MSLSMMTHSGREHHLSGCGVLMNEIDVRDISHHLAQINRFTGACNRPYSVAEHSLLCADLAAADGHGALVQQLCLLHDAHEAYVGDLSSPMKNAVGLSWAQVEHPQADRVRRALGVASGFAAFKRLVYHYDLVALATERAQLTHYDPARNHDWPILDTPGAVVAPAPNVNLNELSRVAKPWTFWRDTFLARFLVLQRQVVDLATTAPLDSPV